MCLKNLNYIPGLNCPIFQNSLCIIDKGQTNPPKLGPSTVNIIGKLP